MNTASLLRICHYRTELQCQGKVSHIFHLAFAAKAQGETHKFLL